MDIETIISIDIDAIASELEDQIRECAEETIEANHAGFIDEDDVQDMIDNLEVLDQDDVQQLIDESMMDVTDNGNAIEEITAEYRDLRLECMDMRNEVEKLRRSMKVLLEERESSLSRRTVRAYNAGHKAITSQTLRAYNAGHKAITNQINKFTKGW